MKNMPFLGFAAYSGTGKTTLLEKLIPSLKARGLRVAMIKHDGHDFEIDHEGTDSWRFTQAGADISLISSDSKTVLIEQRKRSLIQAAAMIHDVDLILVEGYKHEAITQIGLCRLSVGKPLPANPSRYAAIVTDTPATAAQDIPCFGFDDIQKLTDFIIDNREKFTHTQ